MAFKHLSTEKHSKFVLTTESWYPSFLPFQYSQNPDYCSPRPGTAFRVSVFKRPNSELWRVYCNGGDDGIAEKDFPNRQDALQTYENIKDYTTRDQLTQWGFNWY